MDEETKNNMHEEDLPIRKCLQCGANFKPPYPETYYCSICDSRFGKESGNEVKSPGWYLYRIGEPGEEPYPDYLQKERTKCLTQFPAWIEYYYDVDKDLWERIREFWFRWNNHKNNEDFIKNRESYFAESFPAEEEKNKAMKAMEKMNHRMRRGIIICSSMSQGEYFDRLRSKKEFKEYLSEQPQEGHEDFYNLELMEDYDKNGEEDNDDKSEDTSF